VLLYCVLAQKFELQEEIGKAKKTREEDILLTKEKLSEVTVRCSFI